MRSPSALLVAVSLAAAPLTGCVLVTNAPANLDIGLTFAGEPTCPAAVATLAVSFLGSSEQPADFTCGDDLVVNLSLGTYQVQVEALDSSNNVIFVGTQTVNLQPGGASITINLTSTQPTGLIADFFFGGPQTSAPTSADYMTCSEAGVASVVVVVDQGPPLVADCTDATSGQDAALVPLAAGTHTLSWSAFDGANGAGNLLYNGPATQVVMPSTDTAQVSFDMVGASGKTGGLSVAWAFNGSTGCPANVATVKYDVLDATGTSVLGSLPNSSDCAASSLVLPSLPPGVYNLSNIEGLESDGKTVSYFGPQTFRMYAPTGKRSTFTVTLTPGT